MGTSIHKARAHRTPLCSGYRRRDPTLASTPNPVVREDLFGMGDRPSSVGGSHVVAVRNVARPPINPITLAVGGIVLATVGWPTVAVHRAPCPIVRLTTLAVRGVVRPHLCLIMHTVCRVPYLIGDPYAVAVRDLPR